MSVFKRANWHSGLTYSRVCDQCNSVVKYTDEVLDFRPWFADGFVYCPVCKKPLRHNEKYAIRPEGDSTIFTPETHEASEATPFCSQCGHKFAPTDKFCPQCGNKR